MKMGSRNGPKTAFWNSSLAREMRWEDPVESHVLTRTVEGVSKTWLEVAEDAVG